MIVGFIPARGGSKRIPRKNLQEINGKSLLAISIETLLKTSVDTVVVSTDDKEIKAEALKYDAEVIDRPYNLCRDDSSTEDTLWHFITRYEEAIDSILIHQCTCPMINSTDIQSMIDMYKEYEYDSVTLLDKKMLFRNRLEGNYIFPENYSPYNRKQTQNFNDNDYTYTESGAYLCTDEWFRNTMCRMGGRNGYVIKEDFNLDIDNELDLEVVRTYVKARHKMD